MILDSGEPWKVEAFQAEIVEDIFSGVPEVWVVIPEGNAKTTLMSGLALYSADYLEHASIPLAAASRDQAGLLFSQAAGFVYRSPGLEERFRVFEGYRRIDARRTGSRIQVYAADDRTGDGLIPDRAFVDEVHRHRDMRLVRTWRGKLDKRDGQIILISTAGEPGSEFEETRVRLRSAGEPAVRGAHLRVATPDVVFHEFSLSPDDDFNDMEVVKSANPLSTITPAKLARRRASPSMTDAHWSRFVCNVATSHEGSWLPAGAWDACVGAEEIPEGAPVFLGVDVGLKSDATAIAIMHRLDDSRMVVRARVFDPPAGGELELSFIEGQIRDLAVEYEVLGVAFDPWGFQRSAELLEADGIPMVKVPMTNERIVPASRDLLDAVVSRRIVHDGDPVLGAHVANGVQQDTSRGWRIGKRSTRAPTDALVAMLLAFTESNRFEGSPVLEWIA